MGNLIKFYLNISLVYFEKAAAFLFLFHVRWLNNMVLKSSTTA